MSDNRQGHGPGGAPWSGTEDPAETLRLYLAASNDGVVEHDLLAHTATYSPRWFALLGYEGEDVTAPGPDFWIEASHPDDQETLRAHWRAHVEDGWPFHHTWRMHDKYGELRWILGRSAIRRDDHGRPARAYMLFSDTTDAVRAGLQHLALLNSIRDTIVRVRTDGTVLDIRLGSDDALGRYFADVTVGARLGEAAGGDFSAWLVDAVSQAVADHRVRNVSFVHSEAAAPRYFEARVAPSGSDEGVALLRDVTDQRSLEEELAQARRLESIGQLAAGIAHEINTPLQYIGDNARFLQKVLQRLAPVVERYQELCAASADPDVVAEAHALSRRARVDMLLSRGNPAADACVGGVRQVADIVSAMKSFSHQGRREAAPASLNRSLENTTKVCRNAWKNVADIEFALDPDLPELNCFEAELNQVFLNIVVNAAHALEDRPGEAKGRIFISTRVADEGRVEVRIRDDGPGMSAEVKDRIFDPFFTTKAVGKGTGQGLAVARRIVVERHGGELLCESAPGAGTTFVVRLPRGHHQTGPAAGPSPSSLKARPGHLPSADAPKTESSPGRYSRSAPARNAP